MNGLHNLAIVELDLQGEVRGLVQPDHAHAALCTWLDRGDHHALRKPFALQRLQCTDERVGLRVSTLTLDALGYLHQGLARSPHLRLGASQLTVRDAVVQESAGWTDLLDRADSSDFITLRFDTPTAFRSRNTVSVMPTPGLVFGHLRAVWSHWAPAELQPHIDLSQIPIFIDHLEGVTAAIRVRNRPLKGFVGTVTFNLGAASERDQRVLSALTLLAQFTGVGAYTTVGMGAVTVLHDRPSLARVHVHEQRKEKPR